ncbi:MAG: hypothetical protein CMB64_03325 [Euryarchaeota archaeon]|nr:hypothetical protein [Euryarchaeota archaeon]|tara:strand:+ start:3424 stop:3810 length:387 start_codon:yes stop_codon:yes gene_type:complete
MPTCRHCGFTGDRMNFIHGNGPRKDVCANCGVKRGLTTNEEATNLFSNDVANARINLVSRRWAPLFWIVILWNAWYFFIKNVEIWNWVVLGILVLVTLTLPIFLIITSATYSAKIDEVTPDYKRPKGH